MSLNPAPTDHPIHELIAGRWSARAIDSKRPVEPGMIAQLLEAARWAPSCFGDQPWRYLVWDKHRNPEAWESAASVMAEGNQIWARNAPVLLMSLAFGEFRQNQKPNRWAQHDVGAASQNLCLQGLAMGLVVHQMGGFSVKKSREQFNIDENLQPMAMIAVGWPGDAQQLGEDHREAERAPRKRMPLEEFVFNDGF